MINCLILQYFNWCPPRLGIAAGSTRGSVAWCLCSVAGKMVRAFVSGSRPGSLGGHYFLQLLSRATGFQ